MANHYVRDGATGTADGSDWTNAWTDLPAELTRGDTYYVADGTYGGYVFNDADSGTDLITIKKATASDHGTETGWDAAYGDGQAEFMNTTSVFTVNCNYLTIDGVTGSGDTGSSYGFRIYTTSITDDAKGILVYKSDGTGYNHLTVQYCEIAGPGYSYADNGDLVYLVALGGTYYHSDITVAHCFIHGVSRTAFYVHTVLNLTVEYNVIKNIYGEDALAIHGEAMSIYCHGNMAWKNACNAVVRYNKFVNIEGTGTIIFQNNGPAQHQGGWKIYGNVFYNDAHKMLDDYTGGTEPSITDFTGSDGVIADTGNDWFVTDILVYNNTFVDILGVATGVNWNAGYTGVIVRNNLWVNPAAAPGTTGNTSSENTTDGDTSLFVSYANHDYHLADQLTGADLGSPYMTDMDGNSGTSRGAFQYSNLSFPFLIG